MISKFPRSIYQYFNMAPRLSLQTSIFGSVFFAPKSVLVIGHVRYINILTWLLGFQVKPLYLVLFSLYRSLFWELRDKENLKDLQFWPVSLGAMLEYWYIERGLLREKIKFLTRKPRKRVRILKYQTWPIVRQINPRTETNSP